MASREAEYSYRYEPIIMLLNRYSKKPLRNLYILFFLSVISVPSVVFQQVKSTTEGTEFTEQVFSELP
jgi:hypothetical protein